MDHMKSHMENHMESNDASGTSDWMRRFHGIERTEEQLVHTNNTAQNFCDAVDRTATDTTFEREPSQFSALLHALAPESLKK